MAIPFYGDTDHQKNQLQNARFHNLPNAPTSPGPGQFYFDSVSLRFYGWNTVSWVDLSQVINSPMSLKGEIVTAASNPGFPASPSVGDTYLVTVQEGTVGGLDVEIGDELIYSTSGWFILQRNLKMATQAIAGFLRLATTAEVVQGLSTTSAVSPATLTAFLQSNIYTRKVRAFFPSLVAGVATTVTHGLAVANQEDVHISCYQGGRRIYLDEAVTGTNTITVTASPTLSNVTVVIIG